MFPMLQHFLSQAADTVAPPLLQSWRTQLLERVLRNLCLLGLVALIGGVWSTYQHTAAAYPIQAALAITAYSLAYGVLLLITRLRRLAVAVRAGVVLSLLIGVGIVDALQFGLSGDGRLFFFTAVVLAAALFASKPLFALTLGIAPLILLGGLLSTGVVTIDPTLQANAAYPLAWISSITVFTLLIATVIVPITALLTDLSQRLAHVSMLLVQAQAVQVTLEAEVTTSTALLVANETRYRIFSELTSDYVYAMQVGAGGEMQRLWVTDAFTRISGYTPDELSARGGWPTLIHPSDLPAAVARRAVLLANHDDVREFRIIAKDGSVRWLRDYARPMWDEDTQRVVQILGAAQDITAQRAVEAQLRLRDRAIAATSTGIVITDAQQPDNPLIDCNVAFEQMTGYRRAEVVGNNCRFLQDSTTDPEALQVIRAAIAAQQSCRVVLVNRRKDGTTFWNELSISPVHDDHGQLTHFIGIQVDVTDRIASERAMREGEARLQNIVGTAMDAIITVDRDGRITLFNAAAEQLLGCPVSEALGQLIDRFIPLPQRMAHREHIAAFATTGATSRALGKQLPLIALHMNGAELPIEASISKAVVAGEQLFTVIVRDIRARLQAEAALRASEERFALAFHASPIAISITTFAEGQIVDANSSFLQLMGLTREDLIGQTVHTLRLWADPEDRVQLIAALLEEGTVRSLETRYRTKAGAIRTMRLAAERIMLRGETCLLALAEDITAQQEAAQALQASEARFQAFMDYIPAGAWITNVDGVVRYVNPTYSRMFTLQTAEPINASLFTLFPTAVAQLFLNNIQAVAQSGVMLETIETAPRHFDGTMGDFLVYKFPLPIEGDEQLIGGIAVDITERTRAEAARREFERKLLETQKLESLGVLAGGIAHDFNNLLVAMLGNAELALGDLEPQHPAWSSVMQLQQASQRAAELTNQLLAYSGKGRFLVASLDLNALIVEMTALLRVSVPKAVTIQQHLAPNLPPIDADSTQIRQVLMNLVINAAEAITGPGAIHITTALRPLDAEALSACVTAPDLAAGDYVVVEIADTGYGMDAETKAKIFEPFFTTKFTGRGLGLAAVLGIMRGHQGAISITSLVGQGTTMTALFPAIPQPTAANSLLTADIPLVSSPTVGTTILLIDDELEVRRVIARMLRRLGYTVLEAADGLEGLTLFQQHAATITCALLDLTMPQMGGATVVEQLRVLCPQLPIVVMSGYSEMEMHEQFASIAPDEFLQKPFTPAALQAALRRAVGS